MADTPPEHDGPTNAPPPASSRVKSLTPEQRRFLGTPRARAHEEREDNIVAAQSSPQPTTRTPEKPAPATFDPAKQEESPIPLLDPNKEVDRGQGAPVLGQTKASRHLEMQHAFLIIGVLILIAAIFFAGRKYDHLVGFIMSRVNKNELATGPDQFPELSSDELIESGLAAERRGDWAEAAQRLIEAKRKDLRYQGILFHLGKSAYNRRDWDAADHALEQALKFGENVAVANQLRGLIAVRRRDLPAAERYFEAAAKAEPFLADFLYLWGDTLRLNQHPREAIRRYQQGVQRSRTPQDAALFQYKIRLARIDAAEASALAAEVEAQRKAGPLSVDWLMTDAALQLQAGKIKEAAQLIADARAAGMPNLFVACAGDNVFLKASEIHPEVAAVAIATPVK